MIDVALSLRKHFGNPPSKRVVILLSLNLEREYFDYLKKKERILALFIYLSVCLFIF